MNDTQQADLGYDQKTKKFTHTGKDEITEDNCKFSEGDILSFTRVRFPGHAKSYPFLIGNRSITYGQKVVAMSDRGMAVGYINSFEYELPFKKNMLPLRSISKIASEDDIGKEQDVYKRQKEVETLCQDLISKHKLDMNMTHVEFTQFGKKVVFYFTAAARVDFRGLVKDLVTELKLRIELRQISVRDRAASMGAIGPCGRELCCSSFLTKYGNVSIKMAKNQNLTLNYSKLNGVCGQLKCCLSYEEDVYSTKRKKLPSEGSMIQTKSGDSGKVRSLNILKEQFDLLSDKGLIKRFTADQVTKRLRNDEYKFPHRFENISDETANVVGFHEMQDQAERQQKRDMEKLTKQAKRFAVERIIELSDFLPPKEEGEREAQLKAIEEEIVEQNNKPLPDKEELNDFPAATPKMRTSEAKTATQETPKEEIKTSPERPKSPNRNRNNRNRNNRNKSSRAKKPEVKKD